MGDQKPTGDHAHLLGVTPDGEAIVERYRNGVAETGVVVHVENGKPLLPGQEYVRVVPDNGCHRIESIYGGEARARGPAKVTSEGYRAGWDAIWSKGSEALN